MAEIRPRLGGLEQAEGYLCEFTRPRPNQEQEGEQEGKETEHPSRRRRRRVVVVVVPCFGRSRYAAIVGTGASAGAAVGNALQNLDRLVLMVYKD